MSMTAVLATLADLPRELILPPSSLFLLMLLGLLLRRRSPAAGRVVF
jgi:hypothetical protein